MMTRQQELDWLASLKRGDEVGVDNAITRVYKVTATQIITQFSRYNRKTGRKIGAHGFRVSWLHPVTDELREKVERTALLANLTHYRRWEEVPTATLRTVLNLLQRAAGGHE